MKRIHGACFLAILNISRTLEGPTPTNISKNSDPETVMKGTLASPAVAFANKVFPVPGGPVKYNYYHVIFSKRLYTRDEDMNYLPVSMAPFGILAPKLIYC